MMIYDKPTWQLMYDMVEDLGLEKGEILSKDQVVAWFAERYPKIKRSTVSANLTRLSTNAPSRVHYGAKPTDDDLFFKVDKSGRSHFRLYDPENDPPPIYEHGGRSSLTDDILRVIQKHEGDWQKRLQEHEKRVRALEQENERLHAELEKRPSVLDEITDEVLKERLSRLGSAPSDTVIREAAVVLEDRLWGAGGVDRTLHGVKLVDAVLAPETGMLIFSTHRGEQEGVRMLYRGAMQFIRNPPMHKLIEYPEDTMRLFIRLIDSLLQLLSEGERRQELAPRHVLRLEFWEQLLEQAKKRTSLHARIRPGKDHWIAAGAGKGGLAFTYVIRMGDAQVELYIDQGEAEVNKRIFDQLLASKKKTEAVFGEPLEWQRLDDRRACRIRHLLTLGGLADRDDWPEIQEAMIDAMVRLEKALKPQIKRLRA